MSNLALDSLLALSVLQSPKVKMSGRGNNSNDPADDLTRVKLLKQYHSRKGNSTYLSILVWHFTLFKQPYTYHPSDYHSYAVIS